MVDFTGFEKAKVCGGCHRCLTTEEHCETCACIVELEAALAEAPKDAEYWEADNVSIMELCRTKLGKRDVHGVADRIEQLAGLLAESSGFIEWLFIELPPFNGIRVHRLAEKWNGEDSFLDYCKTEWNKYRSER